MLALIVPLPALITPLPVNTFPTKVAPNVPKNILRNLPFCYFASFLIVSLMPFINKSNSLRDLTIFIISSISSFEIINVLISDPKVFIWIAVSVADAAAVNSNDIEALLAISLRTFLKVDPFFVITL